MTQTAFMHFRPRHPVLRPLALAWAAMMAVCTPPAQAQQSLEVSQMSLEDLMNIEVTTVSRKAQRLTDTAAAAYVVTGEDIRRSGATSVPEALRMVPGLEVARIGSSRWAVSARGFNSRFANKLLVLIDGRSVYSPLFSGTFWEAEDVLLEDVDRIEVIRGSGAALWGANAVNGIINIVTKQARRTQGSLVTALAGDEERGQVGVRHGAMADEDTAWRVWAKGGERQKALDMSGERSAENWDYARAGFRLDRDTADSGHLTVHGNLHSGRSGEVLIEPSLSAPYALLKPNLQNNSGQNVVARHEWTLAGGDQASMQAVLDHSVVDFHEELRNELTTLDLDFQRRTSVGSQQDLVWGLGYRQIWDQTHSNGAILSLSPVKRSSTLWSAFVHDEITLVPETWKLMAGTKLEHNSFTGLELQPNLRALWTPDPRQTVWAAVSRAVRTPSRAERDATVNLAVAPPLSAGNPGPLPVLTHVLPNANLQSESVVSTELGYRTQLGSRVSLDLSAFFSRYRDLRSATSLGAVPVLTGPIPYIEFDTTTSNAMSARSQGIELALDWHVTPQWRLQAAGTYLRLRASRNGDPANDSAAEAAEGNSPRSHFSVRSSLDLPGNQEFDLMLQHVGARPTVGIDAYTVLDLRWAWRVNTQLELSLVGQNLLGAHAESGSDPLPSQLQQVPRGGYVKARWQF